MEIRPVSHRELQSVVAIHRTAFPDSALTAFGDEVVRRYYAWLLDGPHDASLMGAWIDSRLVGFCAAGIFRGAMNGFLRLNRRFLASRVLLRPTLLASPLIRSRVRSALSITVRFSRLAQRRTPPAQPSFGVLAIATSRDVRGRGAGRALMLEAEARARTGGHRRMVLTVHPSNARAVAFYEQLHWVRTIGSDGTWSGAMHRDL